ncbi:hypothetical protein Enr13x_66130 [Stieleria neptunia]|uniref:Uncharacterized protein n=1 Tax=Stieleria neptunia TaxID=2527979 RepID=A0A518I111_9BACT|nr:hypothetical protein [Stieleria neptunia]QDV46704.1 hypothetical protein Enr13x_66130 [Stieleria neptunia]
MKPRLRCTIVPAVVLVCVAMMTRGDATSPHDVVAVTASNPVLHGLEVKTSLDAERRWVNFRGPKFYSAPQEAVQDETPSYLNWYEIRKPEPEAVKRLEVRDAYSGSESFAVMLGVSVLSAQVSLRGSGGRRLLFTNPKIHRAIVAN